MGTEILRCAQDDMLWPILVVKVHHRPAESIDGPLADKSAVRQYIVRLRVLLILVVKNHNRGPTTPICMPSIL